LRAPGVAFTVQAQKEPSLPHGIVSAALQSWLNGPAPNSDPTSERSSRAMQPLTAGITKANTGVDGIVWNILGQIYVPKSISENSFAWHATFPPGTFVPPHIHPTQDEFIYLFEGRFDLVLDGKDFVATAGDLIRLPMNIPHGIFNKTDQPVKCFFWVTPTRRLYDLFWAIHSMKEQKPEEVVALSAKHEVMFLPPPPGA
jgi:quercetin dioxygenase-like cupin family protein